MIANVVLQLQAGLKDPTIGLASGIAMVAAANSVRIPTVKPGQIYALDAPPADQINAPALVLTPIGSSTDQSETQNRRDSLHSIGFEYATEEPDENEWRRHAMYTAEALMRFLDRFNANNEAYVGDCGAIVTLSWGVDYVTWRDAPNMLRGFALTAEILARDTF